MAQNIYDDDAFFAGYSRLERSIEGLAGAPEWPILRGLLPDLHGLRVVDLGCGFGWFCRWARAHGAAQVLGVDLSENMLARARAATSDTGIAYARADLESLDLPAASFDLAYSSLALHYLPDLAAPLTVVQRALAPGGHLIFSMEHPIYTAPTRPDWSVDADGRRTWLLDSYLREGERHTDWLAPDVVKYHRTIGSTLNLLLRLGFALRHVEEWGPTDAQLQARPEWADLRDRPIFLLVAARRGAERGADG